MSLPRPPENNELPPLGFRDAAFRFCNVPVRTPKESVRLFTVLRVDPCVGAATPERIRR